MAFFEATRIKRSYLPRASHGIVAAGLFFAFITMCLVWSITNTNRVSIEVLVLGLPEAGRPVSKQKPLFGSKILDAVNVPRGNVPSVVHNTARSLDGIRVARTIPIPLVQQVHSIISTDSKDTDLPVEDLNANIAFGFRDGDSSALFTNLTGYGESDDWGVPGSNKKLFETNIDWWSRLKCGIGKKEIHRPEDCRPRIEFAQLHFPPESFKREYEDEHRSDTAHAVFSFSFDNKGLKWWKFHEVFPDPKKEWWRFDNALERILKRSVYRIPSCWDDTVVIVKNFRWQFCYGCRESFIYNDTLIIISLTK